MSKNKGPNINKWQDWRLASLQEAESKEKQEKEANAEEIGPAKKVAKPKTDNEGKREVVEINGKRFSLDMDNATSKVGHTFSWTEICALYNYGKDKKYFTDSE